MGRRTRLFQQLTQGRCDRSPERENQEERGRKPKQKSKKGQLRKEVREERRPGERTKDAREDKGPEWGWGRDRVFVHTEETDREDESQRQSAAAPKPGMPGTCSYALGRILLSLAWVTVTC